MGNFTITADQMLPVRTTLPIEMAERITFAREQSGLSQKQAARLLSLKDRPLADTEIIAMERGQPCLIPPLPTFCTLYGVAMEWVTGNFTEADLPAEWEAQFAKVPEPDRSKLRKFLAMLGHNE